MKTSLLNAVAMLLLATACAPMSPINLMYPESPSLVTASALSHVTVGVFRFEDVRGWPPRVAARRIGLITAELPFTVESDAAANKDINEFVAEAIRKELGLRQITVPTDEVYTQVIPIDEYRLKLKGMRVSADRVIMGRIRYFNYMEPGFAGLLFQGAMPNGKAYVDLDVVVVDPKTSVIKWAGQASDRIDSHDSFGASTEDQGKHLSKALQSALHTVLDRPDFWEAFSR